MRSAYVLALTLLGSLSCSSTLQSTGDASDVTSNDTNLPSDSTLSQDLAPPPTDLPTVTDVPRPPTDLPTVTEVTGPPVDVLPGDCPANSLCLVPRAPIAGNVVTPGRLAVVWFQLNDDGPDPPAQVAYDVLFSGASGRVDIPIGSITAPADPVLYCARACNDEAVCPCIGGPRFGFAYVVVAVDRNVNGRTDINGSSSSSDPIVAAGFAVVVSSPEAMRVASAPLNMLFTAGVAGGIAPYLPLPGPSSRHVLGGPNPSRVYDLNFCPPETPACRPFFPSIM